MGGSDLLTIFDYLTPEERDCVSLAAVPCFEHCRTWEEMRPPFVTVNGQTYGQMDMDRLLRIIREAIDA